jgi:hybrid cluster-associated redox disulfide protein
MKQIDKSMVIGDVLKVDQGLVPILMQSGMHCLGCPSSQMESLEEACMVHGIDVEELVDHLNQYLEATV